MNVLVFFISKTCVALLCLKNTSNYMTIEVFEDLPCLHGSDIIYDNCGQLSKKVDRKK